MHIPQLEGKPFVIKLDGRTRTVGSISRAEVGTSREFLFVRVALTDEEAAGILGAAADKAIASPPPLTESEIEDLVNGDEF